MNEADAGPAATPTPPGAGAPTAAWIEREVRVADMTWRVCEAGSGPVILLLHGTGGSIHSWDGVLPLLAPHGQLVAIDLPGHGGSTYPGFERVTLVDVARAVRTFLAAGGITPSVVVGHSAGAAVMLQLAADGALSPETALVGINPALQAPHPAARAAMQGLLGDLFRSRAARAMVRGAGTMAPVIELLLSSTGSRLSREQEAAYVRTFTDPGHAEAAYAMMANWDLAPLVEALPRISQATLFIVGARDAWVPPRVAREASARLPNARVVEIAGAGHLVHEERPQDVAPLILSACRHLGAGASAPGASRQSTSAS